MDLKIDSLQISICKHLLKNLPISLEIQMLQAEDHWDHRILEVFSNGKVPYDLNLSFYLGILCKSWSQMIDIQISARSSTYYLCQ